MGTHISKGESARVERIASASCSRIAGSEINRPRHLDPRADGVDSAVGKQEE